MTEPINLNAVRSRKTGDCQDWTPLDALKELVQEIEAGEADPDMLYVCMRERSEDNSAEYNFKAAGVNTLEAMGLVYKHLTIIERQAREDP